jgi:hypothetical protein
MPEQQLNSHGARLTGIIALDCQIHWYDVVVYTAIQKGCHQFTSEMLE